MNQLVPLPPTTVGGIRSLKNRLFASLTRIMLVAVLVCQVWAVKAQNLTVSINGGTAQTGKATLQEAIESSGVNLNAITSIEVTAGDFTAANWEYLGQNTTKLSMLSKFIITDGISTVEDIPDYPDENSTALRLKKLQELFLAKISKIGSYAFYSCYDLISVTLPEATIIGSYSFAWCSALTSVNLPTVTNVHNRAFLCCSTLTTVSLPSVANLGDAAFAQCNALTTVSLPTVKSLGRWAFNKCKAFTYLELGPVPPNLVEYSAFMECIGPRYLTVSESAVDAYRAVGDGGDSKGDNKWFGWRINEQPEPLTIKVNGQSTESNGSSLQEAITVSGVMPINVIQLEVINGDLLSADGTYMVDFLTSLEKLSLLSATEFELPLGKHPSLKELNAPLVKTFGYVFGAWPDENKTLTTVNLPAATSIASNAFSECIALTTINLPAAERINSFTFRGCTALITANLPAATHIYNDAFSGCIVLDSVNLPSAKYIDNKAFLGCKSLSKLSLPASFSFGDNAFKGCSSLSYLEVGAYFTEYFAGNPPKVGKSVFEGCPSPRYLQIVDADGNPITGTKRKTSISKCKSDSNWDNNTNTWCGWTLMLSIAATANPADGGNVSGTGSFQNGTTATLQATPNDGYRFVKWSDGVTDNPYSLTATKDTDLVAEFEIITYTLTYTAGEGGSIIGNTLQTIAHGQIGTEVEAVPNIGYRFVKWSDGVLAAKRTDANVNTDTNVIAEFEILSYTLTYTANTGGFIIGNSSQIVQYNQSGTEVEANPESGYQFLLWSDGLTTAKRTDSNVKANLNVQAEFIDAGISVYSLNYTPGEGGCINGAATQRVVDGQSSTEVEAVPNAGYRFVKWSDGLTTAKRTDTNVTANIKVTALFEIITYTLTYTAGDGGSIRGQASQTVQHGQSGTEVEAVPNAGYRFVKWSDGLTSAKRTDTNVQANLSVTAIFELIPTYTLTYTAGAEVL